MKRIKETIKKITLAQGISIVLTLTTIVGGVYTFGYKQGYRDYEIKICYDVVKQKDKENLVLTNGKQDLKNKVAKYKTVIFALKREKKEIGPVLKYLLEEYEKDIKRGER